MVTCRKTPFHPDQPFFFPHLVPSSSKPPNIKNSFLRLLVELQTQFFLPKFFGATFRGPENQVFLRLKQRCHFFFDINRYLTNISTLFGGTTTSGPPKNYFFEQLKLECQFFDISRYLTCTLMYCIREYHPLGYPPLGYPKINLLNG